MEDMLAAINRELSERQDYIPQNIDTIYFGGGTPSLLSDGQLGRLLNQIHALFNVSAQAEITLEANPEDINRQKVKAWLELGINRLSLGVQSFNDQVLQKLNRGHSGNQAIKAIATLQDLGLTNVTIDLIYGIPGQDFRTWESNLLRATAMGIPHLSGYALTVEEKTALGNWQKKGRFRPADEAVYAEEYQAMCHFLAGLGYEHYEVSSFAQPGYASRHNMAYWQQEPYLGLGPGAHSYNGCSRQFNISNNARYIKAINNGAVFYEVENLGQPQLYNEYILTGLRTNRGINFSYIRQTFGLDIYRQHKAFINQCLFENKATLNDGRFVLTDNALILADSVIVELMIDDP